MSWLAFNWSYAATMSYARTQSNVYSKSRNEIFLNVDYGISDVSIHNASGQVKASPCRILHTKKNLTLVSRSFLYAVSYIYRILY